MRNSPYPGTTIGSRSHDIFPLDAKPGLIQGIEEVREPRLIDVAALRPFDLLEPGQVTTFAEGGHVEVVEFAAVWMRDGTRSELRSQVVRLEPGAKLTGPVAWRMVDASRMAPAEKGPPATKAQVLTIVGVFAALLGFLAWLMLPMFLMVLGGMAFLTLGALVASACSGGRLKVMAKAGSAYVLAPRERLWAAHEA